MRILLINPPSPEPLAGPLLGLQYVAAALLEHAHEVRVIDAAARYFEHDAAWIITEAERFAADIVGFGLFTRWVRHAYALVELFQGRFPLLVAGGPHTTVCAEEVLDHGFDVAVLGEAEGTIVRLAAAVEQQCSFDAIPGIVYRASDGTRHKTKSLSPIRDLDALALPQHAQPLFDPRWYDRAGEPTYSGGIITSRGCPARCVFCGNSITGRSFRARSPESVIFEINLSHARWRTEFFAFWDDALTANKARVYSLCEAIERDVAFKLRWSAITTVSMVSANLLRAMKRAGLESVNFGVESGDDEILRAIRKGITTDQVIRALEMAKEVGLRTVCNFMLGFPEDTPDSLDRTLRFMEEISPLVDRFSTLGVVVPLPGTDLYETNHERCGFTQWWLREGYDHYAPAPPMHDRGQFAQDYANDPNLDLDFFRYNEEVRQAIRACLRYKAEHNLRRMWPFQFGSPLQDGTLHPAGGHDA